MPTNHGRHSSKTGPAVDLTSFSSSSSSSSSLLRSSSSSLSARRGGTSSAPVDLTLDDLLALQLPAGAEERPVNAHRKENRIRKGSELKQEPSAKRAKGRYSEQEQQQLAPQLPPASVQEQQQGQQEEQQAGDMDNCPVCFRQVAVDELATHVNACLDGVGTEADSASSDAVSASASSNVVFRQVSSGDGPPSPATTKSNVYQENNNSPSRVPVVNAAAATPPHTPLRGTAAADEPAFTPNGSLNLHCALCAAKHSDYSSVHMLEQCSHIMCRECGRDYLTEFLNGPTTQGMLVCPRSGCGQEIIQADARELLDEKDFSGFLHATVSRVIDGSSDFVRCPNEGCGNVMELAAPENAGVVEEGAARAGAEMSEEALAHKAKYRLRCRECDCIFCTACKLVPYHEGFSCAAFEVHKASRKCRFCGDVLPALVSAGKIPTALRDVCTKEECLEKRKRSCSRMLKCGHACGGVAKELQCLPCMQCPEEDGGSGCGDDYCNICWVEDLQSAPVIELGCGHRFHVQCVEDKLAQGWSTAHISFGYAECPLCRQWMQHDILKNRRAFVEAQNLRDEIRSKAVERAKQMQLAKIDAIKDQSSKWHNNVEGYALAKFSYYQCQKCKHAYFGGERACGDGVAEQQALEQQQQEQAGEVKRDDLVCGKCSDFSAQANCSRHGSDYIEYKCKYCCNVAVWFCWGNTHFCDPCHKKSTTLPKMKRSQLPKCTCNVKHPQNGEEFLLGCSLCRLQCAEQV